MDFLESVARLAAAITAIAGGLAVLLHRKSPVGKVVRWFARRNVVDPTGLWFRGQVVEVVQPQLADLTSTLAEFKQSSADEHAEVQARLVDVEERLHAVETQLKETPQ